MIKDPVSQMGQSNKKSNKKVGRRSQARKEAKKKAKKTIVTSSMQVSPKTLDPPPPTISEYFTSILSCIEISRNQLHTRFFLFIPFAEQLFWIPYQTESIFKLKDNKIFEFDQFEQFDTFFTTYLFYIMINHVIGKSYQSGLGYQSVL